MCNGNNHRNGCRCGFGPPYDGELNVIQEVSWTDEMLADPTSVDRRLDPLGLAPSVDASYRSKIVDLVRERRKHGTRAVVSGQFFQQLAIVLQPRRTEEIQVPLFRLHSPAVAGSRVDYSEGYELGSSRGWRVTIPGFGAGKTKTLGVGYTNTYASVNGECKEVWVPVRIRIFDVATYENGVLVGQGISAEAEGHSRKTSLRQRGIRSFSPTECAKRHIREDGPSEDFLLAGDKTGEPMKHDSRWSLDVERVVSLHLSGRGIGFEPTAFVKRSREIRLHYTLPPGHDYRAWRDSGGVYWAVGTSKVSATARAKREPAGVFAHK